MKRLKNFLSSFGQILREIQASILIFLLFAWITIAIISPVLVLIIWWKVK